MRKSMLGMGLIGLVAGLSACSTEGCLNGADGCVIPSPCEGLEWTCSSGESRVYTLAATDQMPGGMNALASPGDLVLENDHVVVVIDALDHPHSAEPTGGGLLDMLTRGDDNDSTRTVSQMVSALPADAAHYTSLEVIEDGDIKAVQVKGHLEGNPAHLISTRYEIRPCEPGIRVRTELTNLGADPESWALADLWYWGDREMAPFTPGPGNGFAHPTVSLSGLGDAMRATPYLVAGAHTEPAATYSSTACNLKETTGFHASEVSYAGAPTDIVMPGGIQIYERFIGIAKGASIASGADIALEVRKQLFAEDHRPAHGQVLTSGTGERLDAPIRASVQIYEGTRATPADERIPVTQTFLAADGSFDLSLPVSRHYLAEVEAFGRVVGTVEFDVANEAVTIPDIEIAESAQVTLNASLDGEQRNLMIMVYPADQATDDATRAQLFGELFKECAPLLGHPVGGSPACNRILVDGPTVVTMPPGNYDFFSVAGPFTTLVAQRNVVVEPHGGASVQLDLSTLPIQPEGTLTGDFHVHGSPSFDTMTPDIDRVRAWMAANMQVIASTDHDVVGAYLAARQQLGADEAMRIMIGMESTGHALFRYVPGSTVPKVIGHWNFWPVPYDPTGPYRGGAWDELVEPGALFSRMKAAGWDDTNGVLQLNHPWGGVQFGRDFGWGTAIELDLTRDLPVTDDGTPMSLFHHRPLKQDGTPSEFANDDYDVQEVMNGTDNLSFLQYRAVWFYLLNQGVVRGGTANSDSHYLAGNLLGVPRNLVWTRATFDSFDPNLFNQSVRAGTSIGTNGPVLQVTTTDSAGVTRRPGVEAFAPAADAQLHIELSAAPWVPVEEIRVYVNGELADTVRGLTQPADPFGEDGIERYSGDLPLADLLPASGDAWIVVEAGTPLVPNADLDCNGIPDTGDNNGDGSIDWRDVAGTDLSSPPTDTCLSDVGPLSDYPDLTATDDPIGVFQRVTPGGFPLAFTNPFILDRDGNGFQGVR